MRLLVVEDDPNLQKQIQEALDDAGYIVDAAKDGEEGHYLGDTEPYDAIILDLGLPKIDGLTVLEKWRNSKKKFPVLILTARDRWSEKVSGFDAGADDYLTKPFQMEELLARLRALIRRSAGHATSDIEFGPIKLETKSNRVYVDGKKLKLTSHEYKKIENFLDHQEKVISRTELTEHIYDQDFDRDSNTIEVFIGRLRKKLGLDIIKTERGYGYRLSLED